MSESNLSDSRNAVFPADAPSVVCTAPDARKITIGHPSIITLASGRIIVAFDYQGPGLGKMKGKKGKINRSGHWIQGAVMVSTDHGKTWQKKLEFPAGRARLFVNGNNLYLLGYTNGLQIMQSGDGGENWTKPEKLATSLAGNSCFEGGCPAVLSFDDDIMAAVFNLSDIKVHGDVRDLLRPVILRAKCGASLCSSKSWSVSPPGPQLSEFIDLRQISAVGAPVFAGGRDSRQTDIGGGRWAGNPGWSNPRLVRITDPGHPWQNRDKTALHLLASASLQRANCAVLLRADTGASHQARFEPQSTPCGTTFSLLPIPGGHLPFDIFYDEKSERFWLISNVADNSMIPPRHLPPTHAGLPCEQRVTLQVYTSRNLVDWMFAAYAISAEQHRLLSIHEPAATVHGDDLYIVARASDSQAKNDRDSNNIIFTTIHNFRDLAF